MKTIYILLVICTLFSCSDDRTAIEEEEACTGVIDFGPTAVFLIQLLDQNGNNLIENGFYKENQFSLQLNGSTRNDLLNQENSTHVENVVALFPGGNSGDNQYLIHLSENDIDTLDFNLSYIEVRSNEGDGQIFCGERVDLNFASYNQIEVDTAKVPQSSVIPTPAIPITVVKNVL